jgi:hypothetical protein
MGKNFWGDCLPRSGDRKAQPFTEIECIRRWGDELRSQSAKKREHFLAYAVNKYNVREIHDQFYAGRALCCQYPRVLRIITCESALERNVPSIG